MQILLLNQNWFAPELRDMGHKVISCGTASHLDYVFTGPVVHIDALLRLLPEGFTPDRIVWHDNSAPLNVLGLEDCSIPSVMYSVDTHHHFVLHSYLASSFDHVLVAQKDFMHHFKVRKTPCTWFPLWASEHIEPCSEKEYGAVFVGTLCRELNPERVDFFEQLEKIAPIKVMQGHFPTIFPRAEIVVNQAVKGDLNFRVFEAMMSGAMLLTESGGNGLLELFQDGVHFITYSPRDARDASEKIHRLLSDPQRMRTIARQGREEVLAKHTAKQRAIALEQLLLNLQKCPREPRRHYGAMMNLQAASSLLEDVNYTYASELLRTATESARRALTERAIPDDIEALQVAKVCVRSDLLVDGKTAGETLLAFNEAFPQIPLFSLLQIRHFLNRGRTVEARAWALRFDQSSDPEQTFATAEEIAELVME